MRQIYIWNKPIYRTNLYIEQIYIWNKSIYGTNLYMK